MVTEQILEQIWQEQLYQAKKHKNIFEYLMRRVTDSEIPKVFFNLLENHIGVCKSDDSQVITTKRLDSSSMRGLIEENSVCAIHVPQFCSQEVAERLSKQALAEYTNWKLNGKDGPIVTDMYYAGGSIPMEVARRSWPDFQRYFVEREEFISKQRVISGGIWPVDQLRLDIDEAWPYGACLGHLFGQKLRPAIMRVMSEKHNTNPPPAHGFIHTDDSPKLKPLCGVYSANIYLKLPEEGGELYIWSVNLGKIKGLRSYLRSLALTMIQGYLFDEKWQLRIRKLLPQPHIIKPGLGDLVILNSGRPHSVGPVTSGLRVTNQLFIRAGGYKPLILDS